MIAVDDIPKLTDDELFKALKKNGLNKGPVTSSTRGVYEKKLIKFLKESGQSETQNGTKENQPPVEKVTSEPTKERNSNPQVENSKAKTVQTPIVPVVQAPPSNNAQTRSVQEKKSGSVERDVSDSVEQKPVQRSGSVEKTLAPSQSSKPRISPGLETVKERVLVEDPVPVRPKPTNIEKETTSVKENKSGFPSLEFKLIPNETDNLNNSKTSPVLPASFLNDEKFSPTQYVGYIRTDRSAVQEQQSSYVLNRRSIVKLDQNTTLKEQMTRTNDFIQPIRTPEVSPKVFGKQDSIQSSPIVSSTSAKNESYKVSNEQTTANNQNWLKSFIKFLLCFILVTAIVFYFLQSNEEENPIFD